MELLKAALCMVLPNEKVVEAMIPAMLEDSKVQELVEKLEAQGEQQAAAAGHCVCSCSCVLGCVQ
jgi:hypothetical protein